MGFQTIPFLSVNFVNTQTDMGNVGQTGASHPHVCAASLSGETLSVILFSVVFVVAVTGGRAFANPLDVGQSLSLSSIDQVRRDANQDLVPDREGDTVVVAGRATVRRGRVPPGDLVFIQDDTAGIAVHLGEGPSVERGDSLRVRGVVTQKYGLTQVRAVSYRIVDGRSRLPSPTSLPVSTAYGEAYEGQLVYVEATVSRKGTNEGGEYLLLKGRNVGSRKQVRAFVSERHLARVNFDRIDEGDRLVVTGLLSQFDYEAPYADHYQIWPRSSEDIIRLKQASTYQRSVLVGGFLAFVLVVILWIAVKRRTDQLAESQARFQRLAEATYEGIVIHDRGTVQDVNSALTEMTGFTRQEFVGADVSDILIGGEKSKDCRRMDPVYEARVRCKEGSSFPVEVEEKKVETGKEAVGVTAIRDITERKKRETELLEAKEEAEQVAHLKSCLLNNMSHELRTPITSIIGYADLIIEEPDASPEKFARRIREGGRRLSRTLHAVLEMAQIESETVDLQPHEVDVKKVVETVVENYQAEAEDKELAISVTGPEEYTLYTDQTLFYRIVSNLVHNAIKFTDQGSVHIAVEPRDSAVRIVVIDTGIGIDPDFRGDLFEPFKQESEGRRRAYEGIGLGLALTKRIVDLLGGTITVESVKQEGSRFTVNLPAMRASPSKLSAFGSGETGGPG